MVLRSCLQRNARKASPTRIYEQLKAISDLVWSTSPDGEISPESLTEKQMDEVIVFGIANVAILEAYGRLTPDKHNGSSIYTRGRRVPARRNVPPGPRKSVAVDRKVASAHNSWPVMESIGESPMENFRGPKSGEAAWPGVTSDRILSQRWVERACFLRKSVDA